MKQTTHKVWKGTLSFGLVSIPVQVHTSTKDNKSPLKTYRKSDLSPIRHKKVAEVDGAAVQPQDIVKGLPVTDPNGNQHVVVLDQTALDNLAIESTKTITIDCFVNADEIDYRHYEKPYFLQSEKGGESGYSLLYAALVETNKVGIAKVALRNREYLVAVSANSKFNVLTLETLRWDQELLDTSELRTAKNNCPKEQLKLAIALVNASTAPFTPAKYVDEYTEGLNTLIQVSSKKAPKSKLSKKFSSKKLSKVPDMVDVLQASLNHVTKKGKKS